MDGRSGNGMLGTPKAIAIPSNRGAAEDLVPDVQQLPPADLIDAMREPSLRFPADCREAQ